MMTKKYILPVVHVVDKEQAFSNVEKVKACGADGVFLISHGFMDDEELVQLAVQVKDAFAPIWVGVNCLGLDAKKTVQVVPPVIDGIWTDNADVDERSQTQPYAEEVRAIQKRLLPSTRYFGGVAFKYQRSVRDLEAAVAKAAPLMDVICTSGVGTGYAADIQKIERMGIKAKEVGASLAIASGITPQNVTDYLPYVDYYLVATGISDSFTEINPDKLRQLLANVKAWQAESEAR